jgi:hypothetical protein
MVEHNRAYHPDHVHVWGDSSYEWEQEGAAFIQWPYRLERNETVQRCTVCALREGDDASGECV